MHGTPDDPIVMRPAVFHRRFPANFNRPIAIAHGPRYHHCHDNATEIRAVEPESTG
jgi:hypothetical protein